MNSEPSLTTAQALLRKGEIGSALAAAESCLSFAPASREAIYLVAVCLRYLQRVDDALATVQRLIQLYPNFPRAYQEQGHCLRLLRRPADAQAAYETAVSRDASLHASWKALEALYKASGRHIDADRASEQLRHLSTLPHEVKVASSLMQEGNVEEAERVCRRFLLANPSHLDGLRLLAELAVKSGTLVDAEEILEACVALDPTHRAARYEYAVVLSKRQKSFEARAQAEYLHSADPAHWGFAVLYATECAALGHHLEALRIYRELLALEPGAADVHLSVGHLLKTMGQQEAAVRSYRDAYKYRPRYGDAYWSLANLKTYRFTPDEMEQMSHAAVDPDTSDADRYHFCYALGKGFEDAGQYDAAFSYYGRGDELKRKELRYDPDAMDTALRLQASACNVDLLHRNAGAGCPDDSPIFIVGLPRAGSTLLEQILASHSEIEGTSELPFIPAIAHDLDVTLRRDRSIGYPDGLRTLTPAEYSELGERYLNSVRPFRRGARYFIDKNPNNFRHVGLIHLILPNAKIIDARREAVDCCFSCFKQLFAEGQEFTYGLTEIGRYYLAYETLMTHWDTVLPGKVLRVQHEDVVENLELNVRNLLQFLGLPFESSCLEFFRTKRSVRTASSEQVRRPIYRDGLGHWRRFERHLGPLLAQLQRRPANHPGEPKNLPCAPDDRN